MMPSLARYKEVLRRVCEERGVTLTPREQARALVAARSMHPESRSRARSPLPCNLLGGETLYVRPSKGGGYLPTADEQDLGYRGRGE